MEDVIREIAAERRRQIEKEGWTPEHDDEHSKGEMAQAAACYADPRPTLQKKWTVLAYADNGGRDAMCKLPTRWPWDAQWWNPKDRRRDLIRAAALIIAEIERLDRKESAK